MVQAASWHFANNSESVGRAEFHAEGASADQWFVKEANWRSGDVAWQSSSILWAVVIDLVKTLQEPGSGDALNSMAVFTSAEHFWQAFLGMCENESMSLEA